MYFDTAVEDADLRDEIDNNYGDEAVEQKKDAVAAQVQGQQNQQQRVVRHRRHLEVGFGNGMRAEREMQQGPR